MFQTEWWAEESVNVQNWQIIIFPPQGKKTKIFLTRIAPLEKYVAKKTMLSKMGNAQDKNAVTLNEIRHERGAGERQVWRSCVTLGGHETRGRRDTLSHSCGSFNNPGEDFDYFVFLQDGDQENLLFMDSWSSRLLIYEVSDWDQSKHLENKLITGF